MYSKDMSSFVQDLEEKLILEIEKDGLENFKKYFEGSLFQLNSVLRSKHKLWESNYLPILGKDFGKICHIRFDIYQLILLMLSCFFFYKAIACYSGSKNIVEYLIDQKINVNQTDTLKQRSALHWAVVSKNHNIVRMLIDAGFKWTP
jgi:hypothetical protein